MSFNWASQVGRRLLSDLLGGSDRANGKLFLPLSASMCVRDSACVRFFMSQQVMNYRMPDDLCLNTRASFASGYDLKDIF